MTDTVDVEKEVIAPEIAHSEQQAEDPQERNWRGMREALREAKEQAARQNQMMEEMKLAMQAIASPAQAEEDPWEGLDDNDLLEVSRAKSVFAKEAEKAARRIIEQERAAREQAEQAERSSPNALEKACRAKHSDFDQVMTAENVEAIIKTDPHVHQSILRSDDPINAAYNIISKSAAYQNKKTVNAPAMVEKAKLQANQNKPQSPAALSQSQAVTSTSGFARLSKQQQKELWVDHQRKLGRR